MSLINKLERFLQSNQDTDEAQFLHSLRCFLETNWSQLPVVESLKSQIGVWRKETKSDQEVCDRLLRFISDRVETPFVAEKFMRSQPTFQDFKQLTASQVVACLDYDKSHRTYHDTIVYIIDKTPNNTDFVIWLLREGFTGSVWDTPSICSNNNLRLLQYYHENKVCKEINCHALGTVVKNNNLTFFRYILQNNLIDRDSLGKKVSLGIMLENCILYDRFEILKELFAKEETGCKESVLEAIYLRPTQLNPMHNASNAMCLWLWEHGMKWTQTQAKKIDNAFMVSFFN